MKIEKVLHIITVSFVINHFFGKQFLYLNAKTGNEYHLGCSPSKEFLALSKPLGYIPFEVEITRNISPIKDLKAIIKIYKYIKANNIDVVVGHTPKGGMVAMIASFFANISKRIYFRHGIIYETSKGFKRFLLKNIDAITGGFSTKVVCVSKSVRERSEKDKLNDPKKNIILGLGTCNGIDTESKFNPEFEDINKVEALKQQLKIEKADKVIGYVGRLVKDKGIEELIEAWKIIKVKYPNVKLLLVGPIEEKDSISEATKNTIFSDESILFTDFVLDSAPYFSLMDIFILPTYREGFPTVSLEASSMEIPVIITKATGCTESIQENITGVFITHDPKNIAEKIFFYLNNDEIAKEHGANGRKFVRANFEESKIWNHISENLKY